MVEYLLRILKGKEVLLSSWYNEMFSLPIKGTHKHYSYDNGTITLFIDKDTYTLSNVSETASIIDVSTMLEIDDTILKNVTGKLNAPLGIVLLNKLLIDFPFKDKLPFIDSTNIVDIIEKEISKRLGDDITIDEYTKFMKSGDFLRNLSPLFVVSSTEGMLVPPPDMIKFRDKTIKEFKENYGDDVFTDLTRVGELEAILKDYYVEYMKDDPSMGIMLAGKVLNTAMKNMFLLLGAEIGIDGKPTEFIETSLSEGWPKDNKKLADLFNTSRKGSIGRGLETQEAGAASKITLRATNHLRVVEGDCGTKLTIDSILTTDNYLEYLNVYIMEKNTPLLITEDNYKGYIGKVVKKRSFSLCITPGHNYCVVCAGALAESNKDIILLMVTGLGGILLNAKMKAMHTRNLTTVSISLDDSFT